jgi:predicted alpha/beta superfamily hydrolase
MRCLLCTFIAILLISLPGCTVNPKKPTVSQELNPVVLESSQIFTLFAPTNQQNYRIRVRLPASYATNTTKKYPMIFKVDGQWDFLLAASAFNCLYFDGQMPETIFVGIDWGDIEGNIHSIRARDLLPSPLPNFAGSGQAKIFVNAIVNDILPELHKRFRLDGQEFLLGGSWGASFATYALLEQPQVFDGAIAIAGDYIVAADAMQQQIQALVGSNALNGKRLYVGLGKYDAVAPTVLNYVETLKKAKLNGLNIKLDYLEGFGHSGMNIPGYAGGFQYMFTRPQITLPNKALQTFVGEYESDDKNANHMSIRIEKERLEAQSADGNTIPLTAKSANAFYHPGRFFNITFTENQAQVETFYGQMNFRKKEAN